MPDYVISTDKTLLDHDFIVRSLQSTYWAGERSRDVILAAVDASLCFGAYEAGSRAQVGFARIVGDRATFSWLADVFVDPAHRGHGIGKLLVGAVIAHPDVARTKITLATRDAHGLYEQFGFERLEMMRRTPPGA